MFGSAEPDGAASEAAATLGLGASSGWQDPLVEQLRTLVQLVAEAKNVAYKDPCQSSMLELLDSMDLLASNCLVKAEATAYAVDEPSMPREGLEACPSLGPIEPIHAAEKLESHLCETSAVMELDQQLAELAEGHDSDPADDCSRPTQPFIPEEVETDDAGVGKTSTAPQTAHVPAHTSDELPGIVPEPTQREHSKPLIVVYGAKEEDCSAATHEGLPKDDLRAAGQQELARLTCPPDGMEPTSSMSTKIGRLGEDGDEYDNEEKGLETQTRGCLRCLRGMVMTRTYTVVNGSILLFALFGGGMWVILDVPDEPGRVILDVSMFIVMLLFACEVILNTILFRREYLGSLFFWMDCIGTASMVFEISWFLGGSQERSNGGGDNDAKLLRIARATKVGARMGRLSKLMKCFVLLSQPPATRTRQTSSIGKEEKIVEAKVLQQMLVSNLSTKVSLLTFMLVLVVPLFQIGQYPEVDNSMRMWADRLEVEFARLTGEVAGGSLTASKGKDAFQATVDMLVGSYMDLNYFPYGLVGFDAMVNVNGTNVGLNWSGVLDGVNEPPTRINAVVRQTVNDCRVVRSGCQTAAILFNFSDPAKLEAALDIIMIVFITTVMVAAVMNLTLTLNRLLLRPVEKMLFVVNGMAMGLLKTLTKAYMVEPEDEDSDEEADLLAETEMLEVVFKKLARVVSLHTQSNVVTTEEMESMDEQSRAVVMDMMAMPEAQTPSSRKSKKVMGTSPSSLQKQLSKRQHSEGDGVNGHEKVVKDLPVDEELIKTLNLDTLELEIENLKKVVLYIFYDSPSGELLRQDVADLKTFGEFHDVVQESYNDVPYHCYAHAVDVLHSVFNLIHMTGAHRWLEEYQIYALLVASLCHDLGHEGKTNSFLIETAHQLALRYNDLSPLENMHCARLFQICNTKGKDVFGTLDQTQRRDARRICVATILHTDNVKHFEMVKELNQLYEMASEICENQATNYKKNEGALSPQYEATVINTDTLLWMELFLHLADCSNPLKPFIICHRWADQILTEFFMQGDVEKELGLPLGMLNDREKVSRPGSQHGFINFLVSPLVCGAVRLFPEMWPLATQMATNLESWRGIWVATDNPSEEDQAKKMTEVQKVLSTAADLKGRVVVRQSSSQLDTMMKDRRTMMTARKRAQEI